MEESHNSPTMEHIMQTEDENIRYSNPVRSNAPNDLHNNRRLERTSSLMASKDSQNLVDPFSSYTPAEDAIGEDERHHENQSERHNSPDDAPDQSTDMEETSVPEIPKEELIKQLEQYDLMLNRLQAELEQETMRNKDLNNDLAQTRKQLQRREQEYARIEHNFFEHTKIIRATDDDLSTIRDSFKLLKYGITRFVMSLNKKADREKATEKFHDIWPNLPLAELGTPLEHGHINMLTEKLIHQHLISLIFESPLYPGLHINGAYLEMSSWLRAHGSEFSTRLRQQLTAIIAKSKPETDIQNEAQAARARIMEIVYNDLADIYDPVIRESDAALQEGNGGGYYSKIRDIIDKSLKLSVAIRGQDVEITTLPIHEGEQLFDPETMMEIKGKTEGKIKFCICPPFVGGDGEHGFVEKGKVFC